MIDVFDLYQRSCSDLNTSQNGLLRPIQNFIKYCYEISLELHREYFKDMETRQVTLDEYTTPFLVTKNLVVQAQSGIPYDFAALPADYAYWSSMRILVDTSDKNKPRSCPARDEKGDCCTFVNEFGEDCANGDCGGYRDPDQDEIDRKEKELMLQEWTVKKWDNQRWGNLVNHPRKRPTMEKPGVTQITGGFRVMPKGIHILALDYFKKPVVPVFGYTIGSQDQIVYNVNASVQIEWSEKLIPEFVKRLGMRYAKFVGSNDLYNISASEVKNMN